MSHLCNFVHSHTLYSDTELEFHWLLFHTALRNDLEVMISSQFLQCERTRTWIVNIKDIVTDRKYKFFVIKPLTWELFLVVNTASVSSGWPHSPELYSGGVPTNSNPSIDEMNTAMCRVFGNCQLKWNGCMLRIAYCSHIKCISTRGDTGEGGALTSGTYRQELYYNTHKLLLQVLWHKIHHFTHSQFIASLLR